MSYETKYSHVPTLICYIILMQHICRGATISGGAEIYGRSSLDFFFSGGESIPNPDEEGNSAEASRYKQVLLPHL